MKYLKKLNNPILLVANGFVTGAILFVWTAAPGAGAAQPRAMLESLLERVALG
jgi:hypothetical protein